MKFYQEHNRGLIGTIVFHLIFLLVLLWVSFDPMEPTFPDPDGIVIDFGDSETGFGEEEPSPAAVNEPVSAETPVEEQVEPEATDIPDAEAVKDPVVTQDFDDAPTMEEIAEQKRKKEEQKKKLAEQKRKREEEAKKQEEERKRQEEEREKREAEQRRINEINNRTKNLFGGSGNGSGGDSQGEAGGEGNQGKPDGQIGVNNYKGGGSGNGIDWSLNGRSAIALPQPNKGIQSSGKVVVEIIVNKSGKVISAMPGAKGSTTMDGRLLDAAKKAALKAQFNISSTAPDRQKGYITYIFELQ